MYRKLERFPLCNHADALGPASPHRLAANRLYGDPDAADAGFVIPGVARLVAVAAQGAGRCLHGVFDLGRGHAVVELADEDLTGDGARDIDFRRVGRLGEAGTWNAGSGQKANAARISVCTGFMGVFRLLILI